MAMILAFLIALVSVANAQECPTGCSTCDGASCTSCQNGYYLNVDVCTVCSNGCPSGQYQSAACSANADRVCSACSPSQSCPEGTYQSAACSANADRVCSACLGNCKKCVGPAQCQECFSGFFKTSGGAACTACNAAQCADGTYYNNALCLGTGFSSGCMQCSNGCPSGDMVTSICEKGTGTSDGYDRVCSACSTTCPSGTYLSAQCVSGGMLTLGTDITCSACSSAMEGCQTCSDSTTCTSCGDGSQGYYLTGTTCGVCSTNCVSGYYRTATCSANADMVCSACSTCTSGTYESTACTTNSNRACTSCSTVTPNCATCSSSTQCTTCTSSYFVSPTTGQCTGCFSGNCQTCTGANYASCSMCAPKMYLNDFQQNCTTCMKENCGVNRKAYGICYGKTNPVCPLCSTAFTWACDRTPADSFWPDTARLATCCAAAREIVSSDACAKYNHVLTCTGLWTEYPYAPSS